MKNSRFSNIFSNMSTVPNACVATVTAIDVRSDGNAGHGPSSIFGIIPPRSSCTISCCFVGTWTVSSPTSTRTPSFANAGMIETRSSRRTPSIVTSPPVIAAMPMKLPTSMWSGPIDHAPPRELLDAGDAQDVRLDALDLRAERDEEAAEVLHVRLARRVAEHRLALREHRGHDRVLRRHDARLVEEDARAAQLRRLDLVQAAAEVDRRRRAR